MPDQAERFTDYSRVVLSVSQQIAEQMHHKTIGVEHVLIGLIRAAGVAGEVLRGLGLEYKTVSSWFRESYVDLPTDSSKQIELSGPMKRLLAAAVDEARRTGHTQVSTGHILLGLLRQRSDITKRTLAYLELDEQQMRSVVKDAILAYNNPKDEALPVLPLSGRGFLTIQD